VPHEIASEGVAPLPDAIDRAPVAVLAYRGRDGSPISVPVTPLRDGDAAVVTSTLALVAKVAAIRRDPRVALRVGPHEIRARAVVELDEDGSVFAARLRDQELRKFPPSRLLLGFPGHRRLLWWYAGRILIHLPLDGPPREAGPVAVSDRITCTTIGEDGWPRIAILEMVDAPLRAACPGDRITLPTGFGSEAGVACRARILVHDEDPGMNDLRQLHLSGMLSDGGFLVDRVAGDLESAAVGSFGQVVQLRDLARSARRHRPTVARWRREDESRAERDPCEVVRPTRSAAGDADRLPAILSFWMPGLGQVWRRQWIAGGLLLLGSFQASGRAFDEACRICTSEGDPLRLLAWGAVALVTWCWAVVDARRPLVGADRPPPGLPPTPGASCAEMRPGEVDAADR